MAPDILEAVIVRAWVSFNRRLVVELDDPASVTAWSPEKADAWWNYGLGRARLEAELAKDGVHVPILQGAFHEGRVKSLAAWKVGTAVALPRTDLVLVQREVEQKGFFRTRKVLVEGLLTGEETWDLLAPFSEVRREPAEIVIFRAGATAAAEVAARIERLSLEPVESARRTSLVREQLIFSYSRFPGSGWERIDGGVIDFEPSGSEEE
jgi:hypothetical protein